jgi:phage-related protein (TIGR01555 family)
MPRGRPRKISTPAQEIPKPLERLNAVRTDSWSNALIGLNQKQDKSQYTKYGTATVLDDATLAEMYLGDGLASRIVDIIADDMTREWIYLDDKSDEIKKKPLDESPLDAPSQIVMDELIRLDAEEKFNTAIRWQRLFGGSILLIGAMDGQTMDKPLKLKSIKTIEYLRPIDRTAINVTECKFDENLMSPTFGQILLYKIRLYVGTAIIEQYVHYSRVIPFFNDPIPNKLYTTLPPDIRYWGMSSIQRIYEDVRDLGGVTQSTVNLLYEFMIGTYKFEGLSELLASVPDKDGKTGQSLLVERLNAINVSKSILNGIVLDKEEEYTRQYATLAGLPEVIDRFMLKLSGSTSIPVTRLFGRSPAGLNATGENDLRNYYDLVEASQRNRLMPALRKLIDMIMQWKGVTSKLDITFNSLYQLTETEKSEIDKRTAETEKLLAETELLYVESGIRDSAELSREHGWEPPEDEIPENATPLEKSVEEPVNGTN